MSIPFPMDSFQSNLYNPTDMANNLSNKATRKRIAKIFERCNTSVRDDGLQSNGDWRAAVAKRTTEGTIEGIRQSILPSVQYSVIELAHEAKNDSTKLRAAQLVLEQAGQGAIQRLDHHTQYEQLPIEQLQVVLKSKLAQLQKLIPGFSLENLLAEKIPKGPEDMEALITQYRLASKSA